MRLALTAVAVLTLWLLTLLHLNSPASPAMGRRAGAGDQLRMVPPPDAAWQPSPQASAARPHPSAASRSRVKADKAGLNWRALAECESSNNPRAVSASGRYRGAFQMDRDFWRTYGGLRFAARPDLATYAEQLIVAKRGYAARGRHPWPVCGRRL